MQATLSFWKEKEQFFVAHGLEPVDVILLFLTLGFLLPAIVVLFEWVAVLLG